MNKSLRAAFCAALATSLLVGCGARSGISSIPDPLLTHSQARTESSQGVTLSQARPAHRLSYTVLDLGTLGGTFSHPEVINNRGDIPGTSTLAGDLEVRGFLWEKGRLIDLGALPAGPNSSAGSVNDQLQVAGWGDGATSEADSNARCLTASAQDSHAFLWQAGKLADLGTLGGKTSIGNNVNNRGQVAGVSQIRAIDPNGFVGCGGQPGSQIVRAFLYEDGKMMDLGTLGGYDSVADALNDRGQIAGASDVTTSVDPALGYPHHHPFLWTNGVMSDLGTLGGQFGFAETVTNKGSVVGLSTLPGEQHIHAFVWEGGVMSDLGVLDGDTDSNAIGMNNRGQIVGFSSTNSTIRAFIWQNGLMTDLNTLINADSGFELIDGVSINDAGQIAADAIQRTTGDKHAVLLLPGSNAVKGKSEPVPLTDDVRRYLLRRNGYTRMPFLRWTAGSRRF